MIVSAHLSFQVSRPLANITFLILQNNSFLQTFSEYSSPQVSHSKAPFVQGFLVFVFLPKDSFDNVGKNLKGWVNCNRSCATQTS